MVDPISRLSLLVTSCDKVADLVMRKTIKYFEPKRIYAANYFYNLRVNMKLGGEVGDARAFKLVGADLSEARRLIAKYTMYKYVVIPMIMDYGMTNMTHKGAMIVDVAAGRLIWYEPYGTYSKYGASYLGVLSRLGKQLGFAVDKQIIWHALGELGEGLQTTLINRNIKNPEFKPALEKLMARAYVGDPHDADGTDIFFKALADLDVNGAKSILFYELWEKYSSKLCVTLTVLELFIFAQRGFDGLKLFYEKIRGEEWPAALVIEQFGFMLEKLYTPEARLKILNTLMLKAPNSEVCRKLSGF